MAISDTQKVDYLFKKVGYTLSKTDTATAKSPANESIASPLITRGDYIWQQSNSIPTVIPSANSSVITIYSDAISDTVKATVDGTSTANRTWLTGLTNWIDPSFGSTYQAKVYVVESGTINPQTSGYQLFADGSGNNDSWYFDYSSGVLNFPDTNLPYYANGLAVSFTGKSVFVSGARYTGATGLANIALQTSYSNTVAFSNTVTFNSNVYANLNIQVNANVSINNSLTVNGNITTGNLNTSGNVTAYRFYGDGSQLSGVSSYSNANVASYLPVYGGNINANILTNNITALGINGNINLNPTGSGIVAINSNTALLLPVGTNSNYPPIPTSGMVRWNTSVGYLEVYTGIKWEAVGIEGSTTNVVSDVFTGDNSTTTFNLSQNNTTSGTLVSINGVIQLPTTSYTVTGNVITFNETPVSTDIIEVRQYVPSTTIGSLINGNASLSITTIGNLATVKFVNDGLTTITVDSTKITQSVPVVVSVPNISVNSTTAQIDTFSPTLYRTAKYIVSCSNYSSNYFQSSETLIVHDGANVIVTTYGVVSTSTQLFTLSANIYNSNVSLWATTSSTNNIKVSATYIPL